MRKKSINIISVLAIFIVLLGGGLIRTKIFQISSFIKEGDEIDALFYAIETNRSDLTPKTSDNQTESNGILYYYFLKILIKANNQLDLRLSNARAAISNNSQYLTVLDILKLHFPSYLFSIASLILVYFTGRKLHSIKAGILSAFFFSIHALAINTSSFCRFYQINIFFCCLASFLLIILLNSKNKVLTGIMYSLSLCVCVASMMCSVFIIIFHCIYIYILKEQKLIIYTLLPLLLFCLLWRIDPNALNRKAAYEKIYPLNQYIYMEFGLFKHECHLNTFSHNSERFVDGKNKIYDLYKIIHLLLFIFSGFVSFKAIMQHIIPKNSHHFKIKTNHKGLIFASLWTCIPLLIIWLITICFTNIIKPNNLCFIAPGASLFLGTVLASINKYYRCLFLATTILITPFPYNEAYEDFIENAGFVKENLNMNDVIICDETILRKYQIMALPPFIFCNIDNSNSIDSINSMLDTTKHYSSKNLWICYPDWEQNKAQDCLNILTNQGFSPISYGKSNFGYDEYINIYYLAFPNSYSGMTVTKE